jgi:hypothetical protein
MNLLIFSTEKLRKSESINGWRPGAQEKAKIYVFVCFITGTLLLTATTPKQQTNPNFKETTN